MAGTLNLSINAQLQHDGLQDMHQPNPATIEQSNPGLFIDTVDVTTSEQVISLGNISTPGVCMLQNLSDANAINYGAGVSAMEPFGQIKPGEIQSFRLYPGLTFRAQAVGATATLVIKVYED